MVHTVCPYKMTVQYHVVIADWTVRIFPASLATCYGSPYFYFISVLLLSCHTVYLSFDTVHPRRLVSSSTVLWEPQVLEIKCFSICRYLHHLDANVFIAPFWADEISLLLLVFCKCGNQFYLLWYRLLWHQVAVFDVM
jgi:hypothetical protein